MATRGDLLERAVLVELEVIPEDQRTAETALWADFAVAHPQILGALLDAVVGALRELPTTTLARLPRMADFALWATAAESALGWAKGDFMAAYNANRQGTSAQALDASPVVAPLLALLADHHGTWSGTASVLLAALACRAGDQLPPG